MIAIVDYGVGNLFSLKSSLAHLGLEAVVTADPARLRAADRIILPGGEPLATPWRNSPPRALCR